MKMRILNALSAYVLIIAASVIGAEDECPGTVNFLQ